MFKKMKISLFMLGLTIFFPLRAHADSAMLNKEVKSSSTGYKKIGESYQPSKTISTTDLYEIKSELDDYYKVDYEGEDLYLIKDDFYKLNHTSLVRDCNILSEPNDSSKALTTYTLREKTKLTILEFVGIDDFVKVSYKEDSFDNEFINVKKPKENDLIYDMLTGSDSDIKIETETIGNLNSPEVVTIDDNLYNQKEKIGYVHFKDLAISYRDQETIDEFVSYYERLNESKNYRPENTYTVEESYYNYESPRYQGIKDLETIEVHMTGSQVGIDLYSYAVNFLGNPYVFGGEDLYNGIDCSGFTMRVYETVGVSLPHFAQSQQRYGVEIPFGEEEAGDLVFFGTSLSNITHVGIADGYGNMVHASTPSTGIIISPIYNPISIKRLVY